MGNKIITLGEIMLRLSPPSNKRFLQSNSFDLTFGGGEANVALSLANFGLSASYVTKLPENEIGQMAINELRKYGVDTSFIIRGGQRIGIYYLEKGASQRPSKVIYDRKSSAISEAKSTEFDFDTIFKDATWFHFTGITPSLSKSAADLCLVACKKAKEKGLTVSCDINYRKNLWSEKVANEVMSTLMPYVDVLITNEGDIKNVFGLVNENADTKDEVLYKMGLQTLVKTICDKYGIKKVALTIRKSLSADDNIWQAMFYDGKEFNYSKSYAIHIVDRVGAGDSFAAGLIYSLLSNYTSKHAIEFATAASCLKHTVEGDFNLVSVSEVENLVSGDSSGRIQR